VTLDTIMPAGVTSGDGSTVSHQAEVLEVAVPVATMWSSPEAPREVDRPALLDTPDVAGWARGMDAGLRRELNGRTLTQLLLGEPVQVLERADEWVRVVATWQPSAAHPDGYPGWVRRAHLAPPVGPGPARAVVTSPRTTLTLDDGRRHEVSLGTSLAVVEGAAAAAAVHVEVPGGPRGSLTGTLPRCDVHLARLGADTSAMRADLLGTAERFLGLGYLWGGTSAWGLDCSGLVHLVLRSHGISMPRDACDQAEAASPVGLDEAEPGDLYFFAKPGEPVYHVGFVAHPLREEGVRRMLHAPEGGGLVENTPLVTHRVETLVSAGRVVGATG
jgi:gamma-D-glutamyl-L-lysine dipeptidyl-peptidase